MLNVNNKKVLSLLAKRTRKAKKNRVTIIAIVLTCILFTSIFTIGGSIIKTSEQETMRRVGTSAHAGYKYFTKEEYDTVCKDTKIKDISYSRYMGTIINEGFEKKYTEIRYSEDKSAKWGFTYPTTGKIPTSENEIATSTIVLDTLGVSYNLGEEILLEFDMNGDKIKKTFILCGYWKGDNVSSAQQVLVSKKYCDKICKIPTVPIYESNNTEIGGYISADIFFNNGFNIEGKMSDLSKRCGFDEKLVNVGINWAYSSASVDIQSIIMLVSILLLIMISGYLIIYNIFYINVYQDIRFYGLLKTIGTTGKQLKKIVYKQAFSLCLFGIPLGLVFGWIIGKVLIPITFQGLSFEKYQTVSINPLIFIASASFTLLTVWMSCIRPCKIAAKVSPIEAVHYTNCNKSISKERNKNEKKSKKVTTARMALENMKRQKRQTFVVVLSLSLSMILLNSVYASIKGFDMDKYVEHQIVSDFSVSDASITTPSIFDKVLDGVSADFISKIKEKDLEELGHIYANVHDYTFDEESYRHIIEQIFENEKYIEYFNGPHYKDLIDRYKENKMLDGYIFGVNEFALSRLTLIDGVIDKEAFKTGKYILINRFEREDEKPDNFFEVGDKVTIHFENGNSKEYEVMAIVELPYAISPQLYFTTNFETFLPEEEFLSQYNNQQPMHTFFNVKEGNEDKMEQWLQQYCESSNLKYSSKNTVVKEFEGLKSTFKIVGGALAFVLALIGILNFMNAVITSILVRKQELAMMEAIGMTGRQLKRMLITEGLYYAIFTLVISLTLGIPFGYFIVQTIAGQIWFFSWKFTILPIILCIPFLLLVSYLIPNASYRRMCRESVVYRMTEL